MSTFAEILARAQACRTASEINTHMTPEVIHRPGWKWDLLAAYKQHLLQVEAGAKAASCKTEEEAYAHLQTIDSDADAANIFLKEAYYQRWVALTDATAPAKAKECQFAQEARDLYWTAPDDSLAEMIYHARWLELQLAEFTEKSITCITATEAKGHYEEAETDSPAEKFYLELWIKLANAEAPNKALNCTTAEEAWDLEETAPNGSLAQAIYRARGEELSV